MSSKGGTSPSLNSTSKELAVLTRNRAICDRDTASEGENVVGVVPAVIP